MTALLAVEVRRALSRRLVRVLVLIALLGIVVIAVGAFVSSDPDASDAFSPGDIWSSEVEDDGSGDAGIVGGVSFLFLLMALLGGASFVGAEYKAGTITTLLTWEPRRLRVIAAKLIAAAAVAAVLFVVLEAALAAALSPAAIVRGTGFDNAPDDFYRTLGGFLFRGALLTAGCAVLGSAIATVGKNTTAALAAVLGYLVIVEQILRGLRPGWHAWYLAENMGIVLTGEGIDDVARSVPGAAAALLFYLAVFITVTLVVFGRRDVT
jgi:ABC-type transport system involved in multi-copper enzyme maturation permease subunit